MPIKEPPGRRMNISESEDKAEKCLVGRARLLAVRPFSLPAEGGEVKPDLRAEKAAAAASGSCTHITQV